MRELKDPRVAGKMLTVVRVEVSSDASYAKVYVSAFGGIAEAKEAVKGLASATGYIRREVNPENRREMRIFPTEKLESVIGELRRVSKLWNELISEGISDEELEIFHSVLLRLEARAWEIANGGDTE